MTCDNYMLLFLRQPFAHITGSDKLQLVNIKQNLKQNN
jgi:hypothetical protein